MANKTHKSRIGGEVRAEQRITQTITGLATPVNATFTAGAGTLVGATYYYRVSAINAYGETLASTETSLALGATGGVNVNWGAVTGATGYKVYGRSTGAELLIASVGLVTTYLDDGSITPAGALPTSNTTGYYAIDWNTDQFILTPSVGVTLANLNLPVGPNTKVISGVLKASANAFTFPTSWKARANNDPLSPTLDTHFTAETISDTVILYTLENIPA